MKHITRLLTGVAITALMCLAVFLMFAGHEALKAAISAMSLRANLVALASIGLASLYGIGLFMEKTR